MDETKHQYDQPEKEEVRKRIIAHAVSSLSKARDSSPVVTVKEFERTMEFCVRTLESCGRTGIREAAKPLVEDWLSLHNSRLGIKKSGDLNVLFLAGPDPTADLMTFKRAGVPLANIWAIEGDRQAFKNAVSALGREGMQIKLHKGSLKEFLSIVPQQFDILYFDACGPLFGGKPNSSHVIRELFVNQRLAPLSALITNFSEPCPNVDRPKVVKKGLLAAIFKQFPEYLPAPNTSASTTDQMQPATEEPTQDEQNFLNWGRVIGLWSFAHAAEPETRTQNFQDFVDTEVLPDFLLHYSRFTTEFIIRFAGQLLPWWRVAALPGAKWEYFNTEAQELSAALGAGSDAIAGLDHPLYPSLRHTLFTSWELDPNTPMWEFYFKDPLGSAKLGDAIKAVSLIRNYLESKSQNPLVPTRHIRAACNPNLVKVLEGFKWVDEHEEAFCDRPLPHLLVDLLLGLYGYPYHCNTRKLDRLAYKAKGTVMFTDVFILDQARYVYDLLPTLPFFEESFNSPVQQLVLRVCMDAIHRHSHYGCPDLFHLCDLASEGEEEFTYWRPPARHSIGCEPIEKDD